MIYERHYEKTESFELFNQTDAEPYTEIGSKAFLSCKDIETLKLPETIVKIGQWAFAHMKKLKTVIIPANDIALERDVFLDCPALKEIIIYPDNSGIEGLSELMGTIVTVLNRLELFQPNKAAISTNAVEWVREYDTALLDFISLNDDVGFEPVLYGWFNDEGEDYQLINYKNNKRRQKALLCFLRLKYNKYIEDSTKKYLEGYLVDHMPGGRLSEEHTVTWDLLKNSLISELENAKIMEEAGGLTNSHRQELIGIINERGYNPEISAYLLKNNLAEKGENKAFDALAL